jgi:TIR domain
MTIFISHSRQNAGAALKLGDALSQHGVDVWLDILRVESGADWKRQIREAIESAAGFVVLVGPAQTPDEGQRFEWQQITELEYYLDPNKPLIPVVLGSPELPGFLRTRQVIQADESGIDFAALGGQILHALGSPGETIDREKLERGRAARQVALDQLKEYSTDLEKADVKQAGLRGVKQ